ARLHAADVTGRDLPEARLGALVPQASEAVSDLLPHRAAQIQRLSARLHGVLDGDAPAVLIHGDLSPDQVLVSADQTAVPGEGCPGPPGRPGGGRLALARGGPGRSGPGPGEAGPGPRAGPRPVAGGGGAAAAFLEGYARRRALPCADELAAWTARALLAAA